MSTPMEPLGSTAQSKTCTIPPYSRYRANEMSSDAGAFAAASRLVGSTLVGSTAAPFMTAGDIPKLPTLTESPIPPPQPPFSVPPRTPDPEFPVISYVPPPPFIPSISPLETHRQVRSLKSFLHTTHAKFLSQPSLTPSPTINALFTSLVHAALKSRHESVVEGVLADEEMREVLDELRTMCAEGEGLLEKEWAERIVREIERKRGGFEEVKRRLKHLSASSLGARVDAWVDGVGNSVEGEAQAPSTPELSPDVPSTPTQISEPATPAPGTDTAAPFEDFFSLDSLVSDFDGDHKMTDAPSLASPTTFPPLPQSFQSLTSFPYFSNYLSLTLLEYSALYPHLPHSTRPPQITFLGSGPLPLSSILLQQLTRGSITNVDICASALSTSRSLCASLGVQGQYFLHADASRPSMDFFLKQSLRNADVVYLAALVGSSLSEKESTIAAVSAEMQEGALLVCRSAWAGRRLLYRDLDGVRWGKCGVRVLRVVHPTDAVVNSIVVGRVLRHE